MPTNSLRKLDAMEVEPSDHFVAQPTGSRRIPTPGGGQHSRTTPATDPLANHDPWARLSAQQPDGTAPTLRQGPQRGRLDESDLQRYALQQETIQAQRVFPEAASRDDEDEPNPYSEEQSRRRQARHLEEEDDQRQRERRGAAASSTDPGPAGRPSGFIVSPPHMTRRAGPRSATGEEGGRGEAFRTNARLQSSTDMISVAVFGTFRESTRSSMASEEVYAIIQLLGMHNGIGEILSCPSTPKVILVRRMDMASAQHLISLSKDFPILSDLTEGGAVWAARARTRARGVRSLALYAEECLEGGDRAA